MKLNKISILMLAAVATLASCNDINEQNPAGGINTLQQIQETNEAIASRSEATFLGMYSMMGKPLATYGTSSSRADDFGYISASFSQDIEGADVVVEDNNYNWFSVAAEYTSRTPNYANPYMRYKLPYNQIGVCNELINALPEGSNHWAQAKAVRAFAYMSLAPYFAFSYSKDKTALDIPLLQDGVDYTNNPRATLEEVYTYILNDLDEAIAALAQSDEKRADKTQVDVNVAYGLRARCELAMGKYAEAAADAEKAMQGYTPASIAEVSVPSFYNIEDHNWMWGIDITNAQEQVYPYATSASWIGSFSSNAYSAACQCYASCNILLWNQIPATDVRKGWWVDENLQSPLLDGQKWDNGSGNVAEGQDIATYEYDDKMAFLPYTNVKFGMMSGIGAATNNNDWPLMRVEEMILIQAEGLARSGNEAKAKEVLTNFVKTYRDSNYSIPAMRDLTDEIWFQRRVELWGEGFFVADAKRMSKPIVRFHEGEKTNWPDAFKFNLAADDGWLNMRFSQRETDNNKGIIDNTGGSVPVPGQNGNLRDGVTD